MSNGREELDLIPDALAKVYPGKIVNIRNNLNPNKPTEILVMTEAEANTTPPEVEETLWVEFNDLDPVDQVIYENERVSSEATYQRYQRDISLRESDWTQSQDIDPTKRQEWATYRQSLRDITEQPGFPDNITWPAKPSS